MRVGALREPRGGRVIDPTKVVRSALRRRLSGQLLLPPSRDQPGIGGAPGDDERALTRRSAATPCSGTASTNTCATASRPPGADIRAHRGPPGFHLPRSARTSRMVFTSEAVPNARSIPMPGRRAPYPCFNSRPVRDLRAPELKFRGFAFAVRWFAVRGNLPLDSHGFFARRLKGGQETQFVLLCPPILLLKARAVEYPVRLYHRSASTRRGCVTAILSSARPAPRRAWRGGLIANRSVERQAPHPSIR